MGKIILEDLPPELHAVMRHENYDGGVRVTCVIITSDLGAAGDVMRDINKSADTSYATIHTGRDGDRIENEIYDRPDVSEEYQEINPFVVRKIANCLLRKGWGYDGVLQYIGEVFGETGTRIAKEAPSMIIRLNVEEIALEARREKRREYAANQEKETT